MTKSLTNEEMIKWLSYDTTAYTFDRQKSLEISQVYSFSWDSFKLWFNLKEHFLDHHFSKATKYREKTKENYIATKAHYSRQKTIYCLLEKEQVLGLKNLISFSIQFQCLMTLMVKKVFFNVQIKFPNIWFKSTK